LIADLRCGSNCRAGRCGRSAPRSQRSTSGEPYTADQQASCGNESVRLRSIIGVLGRLILEQDAEQCKTLSNFVQMRRKTLRTRDEDWRLERLIDRAPNRIRSTVRFLRQPSSRWLRIPAGSLLTVGGVLWFLPVAGLWMLPIGLALLADDVPPLR